MRTLPLCAAACLAISALSPAAEETKIVLIAGAPSHGPGDHEHFAGMMLLQKCLKKMPGLNPVVVKVWPGDEKVFEGAKAIAIFSDGRGGQPLVQGKKDGKYPRWEALSKLMDKGVGLVFIHYAVDFSNDLPRPMLDQVFEWMGGRYEDGYSTNPHNTVEVVPAAPDHPISRGLQPKVMTDEFYYRIRFRPDDKRVTPIITVMLPKDKPEKQTIAWATVRENGGRSFGFTGGHFHKNWAIPELRRLVLNAILWTAKVEVPPGGFQSEVAAEDLEENLDDKGQKKKK